MRRGWPADTEAMLTLDQNTLVAIEHIVIGLLQLLTLLLIRNVGGGTK